MAVLLFGDSTAASITPCPSPHSVRLYAKKVYARDDLTRPALRRVGYLRGCQFDPVQRKHLRRYVHRLRRSYKRLRPYVCSGGRRYSVPCLIVWRESRYRCHAKNPRSTAYGYYQLLDGWWKHLGRKPTCAEQHQIAARLWNHGKGVSNWALTASGAS